MLSTSRASFHGRRGLMGGDHRAHSHTVGTDGDRRQCDPRIARGRYRVTLKADVVLEKHSVPTSLFGQRGEFHQEDRIPTFTPDG